MRIARTSGNTLLLLGMLASSACDSSRGQPDSGGRGKLTRTAALGVLAEVKRAAQATAPSSCVSTSPADPRAPALKRLLAAASGSTLDTYETGHFQWDLEMQFVTPDPTRRFWLGVVLDADRHCKTYTLGEEWS